MSDIAIRVEGLSKRYRLGPREPYKTLYDSLARAGGRALQVAKRVIRGQSPVPLRRNGHWDADEDKRFIWALRDVSFEVKRGEVVGIIGRNGAGKSTLLKILSRITEPTSGYAELHGRVGSLLEVGTGFHPELTGRENIYLSGALLGLSKREIDRKFDEIVAFAELERFIDTPVKYYSSGMTVRLGFAVAAHLEPEILLVDEVLAVGDAAFQKKCLGKMGDVAREGRTVLFVSHNMAAVMSLCDRSILIEKGRIVLDGPTSEVVEGYLQRITADAVNVPLGKRADRRGNQAIRFLSFSLLDDKDTPIAHAVTGRDLKIALLYKSIDNKPKKNVHVAIGVHGRHDENLFHLSTSATTGDFEEIPPTGVLICHVPCLPLQPGKYTFSLFATVGKEIADWIQNAGVIEVAAGDFFGSGRLPPPDQGPFLVQHHWKVVPNCKVDQADENGWYVDKSKGDAHKDSE